MKTKKHICYLRALADGKYILNVPALNRMKGLKDSDPKYKQHQRNYYRWFIKYCDDIFGNKTYKDTAVAIDVFTSHNSLSEKRAANLRLRHLYLCRDFVKYLLENIRYKKYDLYQSTVWQTNESIEWLVLLNEASRHNIPEDKLVMTCGVKHWLNPREIYDAARSLFYIETLSFGDLYLMDLKPEVCSQIRQTIEIFGKRMLGLEGIYDQDGIPVKKFTQIVWQFIQEKNNRSPQWHVEFPFNENCILTINKWANRYVHRGYIYSPYMVDFALKMVGTMFDISPILNKPIKIYTGKYRACTMFAPVKIYGYNALKKDFEAYIQSRNNGVSCNINWGDEKQVDAYIISL